MNWMHFILSFCSKTISLFTILGFILLTSHIQVDIDLQTTFNFLLYARHEQIVVFVVFLSEQLLILVQILQGFQQQLTLFSK